MQQPTQQPDAKEKYAPLGIVRAAVLLVPPRTGPRPVPGCKTIRTDIIITKLLQWASKFHHLQQLVVPLAFISRLVFTILK